MAATGAAVPSPNMLPSPSKLTEEQFNATIEYYLRRLPQPRPTGVVVTDRMHASTQPILQELLRAILLDRSLVLPMFNAWKNHSRVALSPQLDPLENFQVVSTFARLPEDFIISFFSGRDRPHLGANREGKIARRRCAIAAAGGQRSHSRSSSAR